MNEPLVISATRIRSRFFVEYMRQSVNNATPVKNMFSTSTKYNRREGKFGTTGKFETGKRGKRKRTRRGLGKGTRSITSHGNGSLFR